MKTLRNFVKKLRGAAARRAARMMREKEKEGECEGVIVVEFRSSFSKASRLLSNKVEQKSDFFLFPFLDATTTLKLNQLGTRHSSVSHWAPHVWLIRTQISERAVATSTGTTQLDSMKMIGVSKKTNNGAHIKQ
jgi:hypothetical protein